MRIINIFLLTIICFSCQNNQLNSNSLDKILSPNSNTDQLESTSTSNSTADTTKTSDILVTKTDKTPIDKDSYVVKVVPTFNNQVIITSSNGKIYILKENKFEDIGSIGNFYDSDISLDKNGNGIIIYNYIRLINTDTFSGQLYLKKISNYKISNDQILIDDKLNSSVNISCSVDENGNGLLSYRKSTSVYIKEIKNYALEDKIVENKDNYILSLNKNNIIAIPYLNGSTFKINVTELENNKIVSTYSSKNISSYLIDKKIDNSFDFLLFKSSGELEIVRVNGLGKIESKEVKNSINQNITYASFSLSKDGNGLITNYDYSSDTISLYRVINFSVDKNTIQYKSGDFSLKNVESAVYRNFTTINENYGYVFINKNNISYYSKIEIK